MRPTDDLVDRREKLDEEGTRREGMAYIRKFEKEKGFFAIYCTIQIGVTIIRLLLDAVDDDISVAY